MSDWLINLAGTPEGARLATVLALMSAVAHAAFGALQKGRHDPWLMRGSIDASLVVISAPVALFLVPWPTASTFLILLGLMPTRRRMTRARQRRATVMWSIPCLSGWSQSGWLVKSLHRTLAPQKRQALMKRIVLMTFKPKQQQRRTLFQAPEMQFRGLMFSAMIAFEEGTMRRHQSQSYSKRFLFWSSALVKRAASLSCCGNGLVHGVSSKLASGTGSITTTTSRAACGCAALRFFCCSFSKLLL